MVWLTGPQPTTGDSTLRSPEICLSFKLADDWLSETSLRVGNGAYLLPSDPRSHHRNQSRCRRMSMASSK